MHTIHKHKILKTSKEWGFELPILISPQSDISRDICTQKTEWNPASYYDAMNMYPEEKEESFIDSIIASGKKVHIHNASTHTIYTKIKEIYNTLGYFNKDKNMYEVDFKNAPITISVPLRHVVLSSADNKKYPNHTWKSFPPVRSTLNTRKIQAGLNFWVFSGIDITPETENLIPLLFIQQKITPLKIGRLLYFNFIDRSLTGESKTIHISPEYLVAS